MQCNAIPWYAFYFVEVFTPIHICSTTFYVFVQSSKSSPISTMWVSRAYGRCVCARVCARCGKNAIARSHFCTCSCTFPILFLFTLWSSLTHLHIENQSILSNVMRAQLMLALLLRLHTVCAHSIDHCGRMHTAIQCILKPFDGARSVYLLVRFCTDNFSTSKSSIHYDTMGMCAQEMKKKSVATRWT